MASLRRNRKDRICCLLKGIETGDPASVEVISPDVYIQHNPQTQEGREGLAALFKRLSKTSPHVNIVRIFEDGDYVFGHTEYDFSTRRVGFEVFRFGEGDMAVEHWDNIQPRRGPNKSGRSMVDGPRGVTDPTSTERNRAIIRSFVQSVLISREMENIPDFFDGDSLIQHDPELEDGVSSLRTTLDALTDSSAGGTVYERSHRVLADGDFVLAVCEGTKDGAHTAFYDLFRVSSEGKIAEHWNTVERVAPKSEWKNDNGKF